MRAHCIDFYDENDDPVGDVWLSTRDGKLRLDVSGLALAPVIDMSHSQAQQFFRAFADYFVEANGQRADNLASAKDAPIQLGPTSLEGDRT